MILGSLLLALNAASPSTDGLAAVRSVLARTDGATSCPEELLVRRLVALGSDSAPALFSIATGEGVEELLGESGPEAWLCEPDRVGELAFLALAEIPPLPVRNCLRAGTRERPEMAVRVGALRVLGDQRSAEGLELFFALLLESGEEVQHRSFRAIAYEALLAILRTDAGAANELGPLLLSAPIEVQRLACEALAQCGRPSALPLLQKLSGRDADLDALALEGTALLVERYPWRATAEIFPQLRRSLNHKSPRLRAIGARALGRLRDGSSVVALTVCLEDSDRSVSRAALWALQEMTGETRLLTREDWNAWLLEERTWWEEEGERRLAALEPANPELPASLRALLRHPLGRDKVGDALVGRLDEFPAREKVLASAALAQLGVRRAVPQLVELLFEVDAEVRSAAWNALRVLTGENLPAEPRLWEDYAFG